MTARDTRDHDLAVLAAVGRMYLDAVDADPDLETLTLPEAFRLTEVRDAVARAETAPDPDERHLINRPGANAFLDPTTGPEPAPATKFMYGTRITTGNVFVALDNGQRIDADPELASMIADAITQIVEEGDVEEGPAPDERT